MATKTGTRALISPGFPTPDPATVRRGAELLANCPMDPPTFKAAVVVLVEMDPDPLPFMEVVAQMMGVFPLVVQSEPWLSTRTEVTRWNPAWYVSLAAGFRATLRAGLRMTAHAVPGCVTLAAAVALLFVVLGGAF